MCIEKRVEERSGKEEQGLEARRRGMPDEHEKVRERPLTMTSESYFKSHCPWEGKAFWYVIFAGQYR